MVLQLKVEAALEAQLKWLVVPMSNIEKTDQLVSHELEGRVPVTVPPDRRGGLNIIGVSSTFEAIELCLEPGEVQPPLDHPSHAHRSAPAFFFTVKARVAADSMPLLLVSCVFPRSAYGRRAHGKRPFITSVRGLTLPSSDSVAMSLHTSEAAWIEVSDTCDTTAVQVSCPRGALVFATACCPGSYPIMVVAGRGVLDLRPGRGAGEVPARRLQRYRARVWSNGGPGGRVAADGA